MRCTEAYVVQDREALVLESAAFLDLMAEIWAVRGLDRADVYRELDHRMQLSELLLRFNSEDAQAEPGVRRRFWRPATTKLP